MERHAIEQLINWKNNINRKPLIIQGARQVGKTWLMKEFGKKHFSKYAYFIFEKNEKLKSIFQGDLNTHRILESLEILAGFKIDKDTLIIFDEIQDCPDAITSLKYFNEELPEYPIIAAGSLLGVSMHKGLSFPVGKVNFMTLYPLSFFEFLDAIGEQIKLDHLKNNNFEVLKPFHDDLIALLKKYFFVGGMPEAVNSYVTERDFNKVRTIQKEILNAYAHDFSKHIPISNQAKVKLIWDSIPSQLSKENRKFVYGHIEKGARAKDFEDAIAWLEACGLIYKINKIKKPDLPLAAYKDLSAFKLFMVDLGLLSAMASLDAKALISGNEFFEEFKGSLTEQYVLQQLKIYSNNLDIYYWAKDTGTNELDFVVQKTNEIIPIEVKATINLQAKSLKSYIEVFNPSKAIRYSGATYKKNEVITDIPLYNVPYIMK
ncbi:MAG: ATP-binding protein [Alphaproteobacteria bacterium]|nr:ATP-binding protein [Alphaproteobacteria bacterium]